MKRLVGGLVVGVVLGSVLVSTVQGAWVPVWLGWMSATKILAPPYHENDQILYAEGMSDTLTMIVSEQDIFNKAFLQKQLGCLTRHISHTAGEFQRWAAGVWQSAVDRGFGNNNAAGVLLRDACK